MKRFIGLKILVLTFTLLFGSIAVTATERDTGDKGAGKGACRKRRR